MEKVSAAEASARLRAIQQDWWRLLEGKDYHAAAKLAEKMVEAAITLRRATYNELDKFAEAHASTTTSGIGSNDPFVPPAKGD